MGLEDARPIVNNVGKEKLRDMQSKLHLFECFLYTNICNNKTDKHHTFYVTCYIVLLFLMVSKFPSGLINESAAILSTASISFYVEPSMHKIESSWPSHFPCFEYFSIFELELVIYYLYETCLVQKISNHMICNSIVST